MGNTTVTGASAPVTPSTPQTIEGVTVSEVNSMGTCMVVYPTGHRVVMDADHVRRMGLVVPEPVVACRIGTADFTLTREQVELASDWEDSHRWYGAIGAAARAHLDSEGDR
jgi:hypothetical protein